MPVVEIKLAGKLSGEQKGKIAAEITELMERVAGKPKNYTYVIFTDVPAGSFAIGGEML